MDVGINELLTDYGIVGIVVAVLIYQVLYLQRKLVTIIEDNTQAISKLTDAVQGNTKIATETTKVIQLCRHNQR